MKASSRPKHLPKSSERSPLSRIAAKRLAQIEQREATALNPYGIPTDYGEFLKLCRIRSGTRIIPFLPYDYQLELSRLIDLYRGVMVFKVRQMGLTEAIAAKFFHRSLLNTAYMGAVISINQDKSSKVCERTKRLPSKIPSLRFAVESKTELRAEQGGSILFLPSTDNAVRSLESVNDLFFDESAFVPNIEEIYSAAMPAQEMAGDAARVVIASTMSEEGKLGWFWQMFDTDNSVDAEEMVARVREGREEPFTYWVDSSGWVKVIIHFNAHPIYSQIPDYLEHTKKKNKLTEEKLQREHNLGIPAAGASLFNATALDRNARGIWATPVQGRRYLLCVDPNLGGADYWVTQVWDISALPYSLVAQYREAERSTSYSQTQTLNLMDSYQPVMSAIEGNNGGVVVAENLIRARPSFAIAVVMTTATSKKPNTDRIALAVEQDDVIYPADWVGIGEAKRFSALRREASSGNDDTVMAWAAGWAKLEEALAMQKTTQSAPLPTRPEEHSVRSLRDFF